MLRMNERAFDPARVALILRLGLGSVFVIGGWFKLSRLIDPATRDDLIATYLSPAGYINAFFQEVLFSGPIGQVVSPGGFLAALSTFELLSGLALLAGFLVRPLALIYGLLLWTFVAALPVTVSPGAQAPDPTYLAPALLVQIRDVGLSGLMFALFLLGPGRWSVDGRLFEDVGGPADDTAPPQWQGLGLLVRLSLAAPLLVGGLFAGMDSIKSWGVWPPLLLIAAGMLIAGGAVRLAGAMTAAIMLWFAAGAVGPDAGPIVTLNAFKRELAFLAAAWILAVHGGGDRYTAADLLRRSAAALARRRRRRRGSPRLG